MDHTERILFKIRNKGRCFMNLSIRFPNISAYFEGMNKSFTVFGFEITVYGILVAVGMLLGLAVIMLQVRKHKENPNLYLGMVLISLIGGVIGARLYYLAFSWESFSGKPWTELINIRGGGLAIYGGIFGGALAGFIYCKIRKVSFGQMADTVSIGLLTGQIIGVWGNAFNREAFGEYTDSLFAMQIPLESVHSSAVTKQMRDNLVMVLDEPFIQVHPLFLYEQYLVPSSADRSFDPWQKKKFSGRNLPALSCRIRTG